MNARGDTAVADYQRYKTENKRQNNEDEAVHEVWECIQLQMEYCFSVREDTGFDAGGGCDDDQKLVTCCYHSSLLGSAMQ